MLEEDYSTLLERLLSTCECDIAVASEWEASLTSGGVIPPLPNDQRAFLRHRYARRVLLEYQNTFSSIPRKRGQTLVVTRDLSRDGIAFLHAEQLFPGERITLWLPTGKKTYVVQRCLQHNEKCFEIGASLARNCRPSQ